MEMSRVSANTVLRSSFVKRTVEKQPGLRNPAELLEKSTGEDPYPLSLAINCFSDQVV